MTGWWDPARQHGPTVYRRIVAVDPAADTLTLDIPTRYYLLARDDARVYKVAPPVTEVGIEDLSIGNRQNTRSGWGDEDYNASGTGAYEVHASHLIHFRHALNGWVQRVASYRPSGNAGDYHLLSNGIRVQLSRSITVRDCDISKPQYEGGGGNGYSFVIESGDSLYQNLSATSAWHSYSFKGMSASGNVIHRSSTTSPRLATDFHMHLSMANLLDNLTLNRDYIHAAVRPYGDSTNQHGQTTSQSVLWNTIGTAYYPGRATVIDSRQYGWGCVIGTQGAATGVAATPTFTSGVDTAPQDWVEGVGRGGALAPASLYKDQRARRTAAYPVTGDAYVRGGPYAANNYGTATTVIVKDAPNGDHSYDRIAFLKADFSGFPSAAANAARLSFYVSRLERAGTVTVKVYGYADDSWTESAITWNRQPSGEGAAYLGQVDVSAPGWYGIDVTGYVNGRMADKTATFKLADEGVTNNMLTLNSRENTGNRPHLSLTY
jgi:hypothetical protein